MPFDLNNIDLKKVQDPLLEPVDVTQTEQAANDNQLQTSPETTDYTLNQNLSEAVKVNPDQHAQAMEASKSTGVPVQAVDESTKQQFNLNKIDLKSLQDHPKTAAHFHNMDNAIVSQDDAGPLSKIEDALSGIGGYFKQTFKGFGTTAKEEFKQAMEGLKLKQIELLPTTQEQALMYSGGAQSLYALPNIPSAKFDTLKKAKDEAIASAVKDINAQQDIINKFTPQGLSLVQQGIRSGADSLVQMLPGIAMTIATKGKTAPMLVYGGVQQYAQTYATAIANGLSPEKADADAKIQGAIEILTETIPLGKLEKIITGTTKGITKTALKFTVSEMLGEQLATLGQSLTDYAFGQDAQLDAATSLQEKLQIQAERQIVTAVATIVAGGAQLGGAHALHKGISAAQDKHNENKIKSSVEQQHLDQLNAAAATSTTRTRNKEVFRQFVKNADGDKGTNVHIDAAQTNLYLQEHSQEEINNDPVLKDLQDRVKQASQEGTDVTMPVEDFASEIAGTKHFDALRPSMTMNESTIPPIRQAQAAQEVNSYIKRQMDEAQVNATEYQASQDIYNNVREQLVNSGVVTPQNASVMAQVVPAWAAAKAKREGKSVQQVYDEAGLTIQGPHQQQGKQGEVSFMQEEPLYKMAPAVYDQVRNNFLDALPEDADSEEVMGELSQFPPEQQSFLKQMEKNDWLGFDYPAQAISEVLSPEFDPTQWDITPALKSSIGRMISKHFGFTQQPVQKEVSTDTKAFKKWSENGEIIEPDEINYHKFKQDTPVVLKVFHGTTHEFSVFDATRGNLEGQFGAINYFTSSEHDAEVNYAGEGPDLTSRIEQRTEQLQQKIEDQFDEKGRQQTVDSLYRSTGELRIVSAKVADMDNTDAAYEIAKILATKELSGGQQNVMPLYVKVKTPFVIGDKGKQFVDLIDYESLDSKAVARVADEEGVSIKEIENNSDNYEDKIDEARWEIEADTPNKLTEAIQNVADEYDIDTSELATKIFNFGESASTDDIEQIMRSDENISFAESPDNGTLVGNHIIGKVIEAMGYDSIILKNAEDRFKNMGMNPGTVHVHIFDANKSNIKSVYNAGTFNPTNADIYKQGTRGYYDPANSIIRLTQASDLSTFLHEFAHFMFEMESKADSPMLEQINGWFSRNAQDVADEANGYLGKEFDTLKQGPAQAREFTPAFKKWFGDSKIVDAEGKPQIVYHGTPGEGFSVFEKQRGMTGPISANPIAKYGFFFSPELDYTKTYAGETGTTMAVYLSMKKPYTMDAFKDFANFSNEKGIVVDEKLKPFINDLKKRGYDGIILEFGRGEHARHEYMVFNNTQIKSATGNVGAFSTTNPDIYQQSERPPAKEGDITQDDVNAFLQNKTTGDTNKDAAIRRAVHEQFARGFEQYLMEGKAPSIELRNVFRTIARWLTKIYQAVKGKLNVNLDNEMRQVFDRLVATDEQIQMAEARGQYESMFTDATMAGMTEKEFADYKARQEKIKDKQTETLRDKLINELTRQTQKWWKDEKADVYDDAVNDLKKERVYHARDQLKNANIKLSHAEVKARFGYEVTNKLGKKSTVIPPALNGMTVKGGGVTVDDAAAFLGYSSGSEMVYDITTAPSLKEAANTRAEAIMVERHGDILNDGTIEQQADEAVQNEERGKLILQELRILSKGTSVPKVDRELIKQNAIDKIGQLSFRDNHPGKYRKAEIKWAQESARKLETGDKAGAAEAKLKQIINYYLGMESNKAKNDTLKIIDRMARYSKKKIRERIARAENGYLDQIDNILRRFEFRKAVSLKKVESINLWVKERIDKDGDGLVLSNAVLSEGYITHWKNVSYSDLVGINDSVKNIEHVARYADKVKIAQEEQDFKEFKQKWIDHIVSNGQKFETKASRSRIDDARKASKTEIARKWISQMTKIPFMASWLDGGERIGLSHDVLVQPFTDALDNKLRLFNVVAKPVMDAIKNRSKEDVLRHNAKIWIPEINDNLMGHQILAVALNTGNQGNLKKMLLGEGWANPEDEASISINNPQLQAILNHMTKSDWDLVQSIWDQMEKLYPMLAEVHRKTTGLTPPKVQSTPVQTPYGEYRGGYYPVKYSSKRSHKAEKNAEKLAAETESMFSNNSSIQASVNAGATNERTGFYDRIALSLDVVPEHFQEVIHFITHHDAVRQLNRLINSHDVANAITGSLGEAEFKQLKPWLNDIAKDGRNQPVKTFIDEMIGRLRFGTTLGVMGFKAGTGIMQLFGMLTTAGEVGPGKTIKAIVTTTGRSHYLRAVRKIFGSVDDIQSVWEFASARSKVMNHRISTMDREIKNAMSRLQAKTGVIAAIQETSMKHIALIQTYMVDLPTWLAAYDKEISDSNNEEKAIKYADWAVENLQGSGATKDMAALYRNQNKVVSTLTMFMTYFSSLNQLIRDTARGARSGQYSATTIAAKTLFLMILPVFFDMLMHGDFGGDDEPDQKLGKFLTNVALYPINTVPFVRDVASGVLGDYGYQASPVFSVIEKGITGSVQLGKQVYNDEEISKTAAKNSSKFVGAAFGIPGVNQMWATGEHLYDVMENGEDLTLRELLYGPDRNK